MVIEYKDGRSVGTCSIHCTALLLAMNRGEKPKAILVADYNTKGLIDASLATWVIGGTQEGVMTRQAKWAFGDKSAAERFVADNGGATATFDDAMKAAYAGMYEDTKIAQEAEGAPMGRHKDHAGHDMSHMGHDMEPGAQMLYNPAFGDQIYHTHPQGMWMVSYKFMHTFMNGLQDGTSSVNTAAVSPEKTKPYGYMMTPTRMDMDMHMVMAMYGVTDRLTLMGMTGYQANTMDMLMNMGMGNQPESPSRTNGFGDSELRGIYKINKYLTGSLGLSLPTGSIDQHIGVMGRDFRAPYDMQLGSGTWDLKPAFTYNAVDAAGIWGWGGQAMYTYHPGDNSYGYNLGNSLKLTTWLQRTFGPLTPSVRLAYTDTGQIQGRDRQINRILLPASQKGASMPDADPHNYGGQRLDGLIGVNYWKGASSFGIEVGVPLYQYVNGLQLKTDWLPSAGFQTMF
jgi:hypothetical protein